MSLIGVFFLHTEALLIKVGKITSSKNIYVLLSETWEHVFHDKKDFEDVIIVEVGEITLNFLGGPSLDHSEGGRQMNRSQ